MVARVCLMFILGSPSPNAACPCSEEGEVAFGASRGVNEPWLRDRIPKSMVRPPLQGPLAPGPPPPPLHPSGPGAGSGRPHPHFLELLEKAQLTNVAGRVNRVYRNLCTGGSSPVGRVPSPDARTYNRPMPASGAQTANAGPKVCRRRGLTLVVPAVLSGHRTACAVYRLPAENTSERQKLGPSGCPSE